MRRELVTCCRVLESDQMNMPHAGSIPKQVPQKNSAHLFAKQNIQCGANWDAAHLASGKETKMEVHANDIHSRSHVVVNTLCSARFPGPQRPGAPGTCTICPMVNPPPGTT